MVLCTAIVQRRLRRCVVVQKGKREERKEAKLDTVVERENP
jgi:hypothetical protein